MYESKRFFSLSNNLGKSMYEPDIGIIVSKINGCKILAIFNDVQILDLIQKESFQNYLSNQE